MITKLNNLKKELTAAKKLVNKLERAIREEDERVFWAANKYPIWKHVESEIDRSKAYETKTVWHNTGHIIKHCRKLMEHWVCKYCLRPVNKKYIATGHDHTDYSYDICDCEGAKNGGGKHYDKLD